MVAAAVGGCASNQPMRVGAHQVNAGVAADEPRATVIGRDILAQGGNAVDAATAMGLAMAVTLPTRVGLGGGGICVVHDAATKQTRTLDFLPRSPNGGQVAVPAMLRGLATLHAAHGKMRWEQLVAPAEAKARFETQISRALARDLQVFGDVAGDDEPVRRVRRLDRVDVGAVALHRRMQVAHCPQGCCHYSVLPSDTPATAQRIERNRHTTPTSRASTCASWTGVAVTSHTCWPAARCISASCVVPG